MKCLLISDTHGRHNKIKVPKDIDILIFSGDYTTTTSLAEKSFYDFVNWLAAQKDIKHKIFIAGNHDSFIQKNYEKAMEIIDKLNNPINGDIPANIHYLQDSSIIINDIKFYGSPWTPIFFNWYFMKSEYDLRSIFNKIDSDTNVLITHGPAKYILDRTLRKLNVGSDSLRERILSLNKLNYHIFGHIHEDRGLKKENNITYINASLGGIEAEDQFIIDL